MGIHLFEELPAVLQAYRSQLFAITSKIAQKAALAGGDYLARETPVDTGVARSNWVATIGTPFGGVIPAYVPYPSYRVNHHEAVKQVSLSTGSRRSRGRGGLQNFRPKSFRGSP